MTAITTDDLELSVVNLFANGTLYDFPEDGEQLLVRDKVEFIPSDLDGVHTVIADDRLDLIAYRAYKGQVDNAALLWWAIADANNIFNPFDLTDWVGKDIRIPYVQNVLSRVWDSQ